MKLQIFRSQMKVDICTLYLNCSVFVRCRMFRRDNINKTYKIKPQPAKDIWHIRCLPKITSIIAMHET